MSSSRVFTDFKDFDEYPYDLVIYFVGLEKENSFLLSCEDKDRFDEFLEKIKIDPSNNYWFFKENLHINMKNVSRFYLLHNKYYKKFSEGIPKIKD